MKPLKLIRIVLLLAIVASTFYTNAPALAENLSADIVIRSTTFWDATFNGNVDANRFERWSLQIEEASSFSITVTTVSGNLVPAIYFLDSNGVEISNVVGTLSTAVLTTSQPAGDFYIQVQPVSGSGVYSMTIRATGDTSSTDPNSTIVINPASVYPDENATATVMLNNVPASGYASAEFTCTYDPTLISVSNITQSGLFGTDPVVVVNGPTNGSFIFAIAGSNGQKATTSGAAFTFTVTALQTGEAEVNCVVKVSAGGALTEIPFTPSTLSILEPLGIIEGTVVANELVTVTLYDAQDVVVASSPVDANGFFTLEAPAGTYLIRATADSFLSAEGAPVISAGTTTIMQTINLISGDIDGNGMIDQFDALSIGMNYNASNLPLVDLNNDGIVNVLDLEILAANYGASGPTNWLVQP